MAFAFCATTAPSGLPAGKFAFATGSSPASPYWKTLTGDWLSRLLYLYAASRLSFFVGLPVSFASNAEFTTRPLSDVTGTTGVVASVRNRSFCVLREYDPFATSFVLVFMVKPAVPLIWLYRLLGALLIVLTTPVPRLIVPVPVGPVAQFCHDMNGTLLSKIEP